MPLDSVQYDGSYKYPIWMRYAEGEMPEDIQRDFDRCVEFNKVELRWRTANTIPKMQEILRLARLLLKTINLPLQDCTFMEARWVVILRCFLSSCHESLHNRYQAWRNADKALDWIRRLREKGAEFSTLFWRRLYDQVVQQERRTFHSMNRYLLDHQGMKVQDFPILESSEDEDADEDEDDVDVELRDLMSKMEMVDHKSDATGNDENSEASHPTPVSGPSLRSSVLASSQTSATTPSVGDNSSQK